MTAAEAARHRTGIILVAISTVAWASGGTITRLLPFDPWTIVAWRGLFGMLFIGTVVLWRYGAGTPGAIRRMGSAAILPTLCSAATITLFIPAFQQTSIANALTIYVALPFLTAAIAWAWLGERPSRSTLLASAGALAGMLIMVGPGTAGLRSGDVLAFLATAAAALLTVTLRRRQDIDMLPVAMLANGLASLTALPLAAHLLDLGPRDVMVAAAFGLFPMTLGLMLYVIGAPMIPSALATLINIMEAPIGAFWAWLVLGEVPEAATVVGGGLMLGCVVARLALDRPGKG